MSVRVLCLLQQPAGHELLLCACTHTPNKNGFPQDHLPADAPPPTAPVQLPAPSLPLPEPIEVVAMDGLIYTDGQQPNVTLPLPEEADLVPPAR